MFGHEIEVEAQARFRSWSLVSILLLILGWGYEDYSWSRFWSYVWSRFWSLSLVEMLIFGWGFEVAAWSRIWRWNLIKICWELVIWSKEVTFVTRTQPSGPLCLWQCFLPSREKVFRLSNILPSDWQNGTTDLAGWAGLDIFGSGWDILP